MRVFACMASSLDGKIGPANTDRFVAITSEYDMDHLKSLRDEADGILFGAATFRAWPKVHRGHDEKRKSHHFILTRSLDLDSNTSLFLDQDIPLTIFCSSIKAINNKPYFPDRINIVLTPAGVQQIPFILRYVENCGLKSLLLEGGGQILHQFIEAQVLQELFLTLSSTIIGQKQAPELLGGKTLINPPQLRVLDSKRVGDEIFLHLEFHYR